jgi:hypothetical protein
MSSRRVTSNDLISIASSDSSSCPYSNNDNNDNNDDGDNFDYDT